MKAYNKAEMQIVSVLSNDIVTASPIATHDQQGNGTQLNPGRRSIWD